MHDCAERIHLLTLEQDVDLDEVGLLVAARFVVERGVTLCARLEVIEEIEHDLAQGHGVPNLDAVFAQVFHSQQDSSARLAQLHDGAHVVLGGQDGHLHNGLRHALDFARGVLAGVGDLDELSVVGGHRVGHAGCRGDQVEAKFTLKPLSDDLEVKETEKTAPEPKPQRHRRFWFVVERRIGELELVECLAQVGIVAAVDGIQPGENHGLGVGIPVKRGGRRLGMVGYRVTDLGLSNVLHAGDEVTHLAHSQPLGGRGLGRAYADFEQFVSGPRGHHLYLLARRQFAVDHANIGNHSSVGVVHRVKDHGAGGCRGVTLRGGHQFHDPVEKFLNAGARLARHAQHIGGASANQRRQFLCVLVGVG